MASEVRDMRQMFQKLLVNDFSRQLPEAVQAMRAAPAGAGRHGGAHGGDFAQAAMEKESRPRMANG